MHVADAGHPPRTGEDQPEGDRHRVDVHETRLRLAQQSAAVTGADDDIPDEAHEAQRPQHALAHHGHRADDHPGAASLELDAQRTRLGERHGHAAPIRDEGGDRLEEHPVRAVELGTGVRHENVVPHGTHCATATW